jgi:ubiquinone/menaquinone biosynthesis C-methylase UbiE
VLDTAAGPGGFGIEIAKAVPSARIAAVDWASVLALTKENASKAGVVERFSFIPGSAFELDWGQDYDLILLPNFLHHFDTETCVDLLKKARANLAAGGKVVAVEFVPNEDRVSPDFPAAFSWVMLATTPKGDAYTKSELAEMGRRAGFRDMVTKELPPSPATLIVFE